MSYSHSSNHSFEPSRDFWRPLEHLFTSFPFHLDGDKYKSKDYLIEFYENRTKDIFDVIAWNIPQGINAEQFASSII